MYTGTVQAGLPNIGLPPFSTTIGDKTYSFVEMCEELGSSVILVPVIAILGNVAIAKTFCKYLTEFLSSYYLKYTLNLKLYNLILLLIFSIAYF